MGKIHKYKNGNTVVSISSNDGTRIIESDDDEFIFEYPLNFDCSISRRCNVGCAYCYQDAKPNGPIADLSGLPFIDTLRPYTEIAIDSLDHPGIIAFLTRLREKGVFANATVNQLYFMDNIEYINDLIDSELIHGLGVSFHHYDSDFIEKLKQFPNAVLHVINGIITKAELQNLSGCGLKLLILGYKQLCRGKDYWDNVTDKDFSVIRPGTLLGFIVTSFDSLALEQLNVKSWIAKKQWDICYNGLDGKESGTMYIDLVNKTFALNSRTDKKYELLNDIVEMFEVCKNDH